MAEHQPEGPDVNVTDRLRAFSRQMALRTIPDRPARPRDRSLTGKDRIRARRAANRKD